METGKKNDNSISDIDTLCKEVDPLIKFCIKKHTGFADKYYWEMYHTAIIAVLENYKYYDPEKGGLTFFYKYIMGALRTFIMKDVYSMSSYRKYTEYVMLRKKESAMDLDRLTEKDYEKILKDTGLGKNAVQSAVKAFKVGKPASLNTIPEDMCSGYGRDIDENVCLEELQFAVRTAMGNLKPKELEYVYDMFGFQGRDPMTEEQLSKKYPFSPSERAAFIRGIRSKLLGSRKLRHYLGRHEMFYKYRVV